MQWNHFPLEIQIHIFQNITNEKDIKVVRLTCIMFRDIIQSSLTEITAFGFRADFLLLFPNLNLAVGELRFRDIENLESLFLRSKLKSFSSSLSYLEPLDYKRIIESVFKYGQSSFRFEFKIVDSRLHSFYNSYDEISKLSISKLNVNERVNFHFNNANLYSPASLKVHQFIIIPYLTHYSFDWLDISSCGNGNRPIFGFQIEKKINRDQINLFKAKDNFNTFDYIMFEPDVIRIKCKTLLEVNADKFRRHMINLIKEIDIIDSNTIYSYLEEIDIPLIINHVGTYKRLKISCPVLKQVSILVENDWLNLKTMILKLLDYDPNMKFKLYTLHEKNIDLIENPRVKYETIYHIKK